MKPKSDIHNMDYNGFREQNMQQNPENSQTRPQTQRKKKKSKKSKKKGCYGQLAMDIAPELAALNVPNREPDTINTRARESVNNFTDGGVNAQHKPELGAQKKGPEEMGHQYVAQWNPPHSAQGLIASESNCFSEDSVDMADVEKDKETIVAHPTDDLQEQEVPMQQGTSNDFRNYEGVSSNAPDIPDGQLKRPYQPSRVKRCYVSLAEAVAPQLAALNVRDGQDNEQGFGPQNSNRNN